MISFAVKTTSVKQQDFTLMSELVLEDGTLVGSGRCLIGPLQRLFVLVCSSSLGVWPRSWRGERACGSESYFIKILLLLLSKASLHIERCT